MSGHHRFMFDLDFGEEAAPPAPKPKDRAEAAAGPEVPCEPAEPPARHTDADLEAACAASRQEGYEAGVQAGRAQGIQEAETAASQAAKQALTQAAQGFAQLVSDLDQADARRDREAIDLAVAIVRRLFPDMAKRHGLQEAENLIIETLRRVGNTPVVVVRAASTTLETLRAKQDELAALGSYEGKLRMVSDATLPEGDLRVEWSDGSAARDSAGLWQELEDALAQARGDRPGTANGAAANGRDEPGHETTAGNTGDTSTPTPDGRASADTVRSTA